MRNSCFWHSLPHQSNKYLQLGRVFSSIFCIYVHTHSAALFVKMEANLKLKELLGRSKKLGINIANLPAIKNHPKLFRGSRRKVLTFCIICLSISIAVYIAKSRRGNCIVTMTSDIVPVFRPILKCGFCENVHEIKRIANVTPDDFEEYYAYSGEPVVISDATTNWTASRVSLLFAIDWHLILSYMLTGF